MQQIPSTDLVVMNDLAWAAPFVIDLVYANADHPENIFGAAIYRVDAPFVLHRRLADVVVGAARCLREWRGWTLVLKDGLRTIEAQAAIFETAIVKAHPEWTEDPATRMFATPGAGGHPRGMAVDVDAIDDQGQPVAFGTVFDAMPVHGVNRAHRLHTDFGSPERTALVLGHRAVLNQAFADAAVEVCEVVWPLRHEWWDYRLAPDIYNDYAPILEADLPAPLKMRA